MSDLAQLSARIADHFHGAFGRTPLAERVQDILAQATTLGRFADLDHMKDETRDLLCSLLQLCTECGWNPAALAEATLAKIEARRDIRSTEPCRPRIRAGPSTGMLQPDRPLRTMSFPGALRPLRAGWARVTVTRR
jgi:hypothetical protein